MSLDNDKIYCIEWQDAHSRSGWVTSDELNSFINKERCIIRQVGWILSENKNEIVMSHNLLFTSITQWSSKGSLFALIVTPDQCSL